MIGGLMRGVKMLKKMMRMKNKISGTKLALGLNGLIVIVLTILKLCKIINWSWWWILCPIWVSAGIVLVVFVIILLIMLVQALR
jgi:hypothetical protein